ncbi:MAG: phosphoribosylformylglycinamidine synthase subunit PurL [Bacillota bacterium]
MDIPAWKKMGLKDFEYDEIVRRLGREPNYTEIGMFSVLWSEHCGYKHSKSLLRTLPTKGDKVMVGPGENAGVVDIGDGLACAFKIESHNHPCAVEPYQGAATGIGGIVRDVLAMGARPVILLDSLRFGPIEDPRSHFLFGGVVSGIAGYGNCLGIPTVGGEVFFAEPYKGNPLVNVLCAGLMKHEDLHLGKAYGVGNVVMIVGHSTGRDGIHGATFASDVLGEDNEDKRPNVQVGDPFMEKLLIEACLEMMHKGAVVGIQDMGAAGITSSCAETAARAGTGLSIEIDKVPMREENMTAYDVMLSESQERMLLIVKPEKVAEVTAIGKKWGLHVADIGRVTESGSLEVYHHGKLEASIPVSLLVEGSPVYCPPFAEPQYYGANSKWDASSVKVPAKSELGGILMKLLAAPNIASKETVYRQYDYMVRTDTVEGPGRGAAVVRVKGTKRALVLKTDCNGRLVYLKPKAGAEWAVAEAARNVASTGARPVAITNCLNFGNPERPEIYWQFKEAIAGMSAACTALGTPVTGGNVSFYNETEGEAVYPTPVIGMLGVLEDLDKQVTPGFKTAGDMVALIGTIHGDGTSLAGSEYLDRVCGHVAGVPREPDLALERGIVEVLVEGASLGLLQSAQDVSEGGLAVALAESCIHGLDTRSACCAGDGAPSRTDAACCDARHDNACCEDTGGAAVGAEISIGAVGCGGNPNHRPDSVLFGEGNSAVVVSLRPQDEAAVSALCQKRNVPFAVIGRVGGDALVMKDCLGGEIVRLKTRDMADEWKNGIGRADR